MVGIRTLLDLLATLTGLVGAAPLWPHLDRSGQLILPLALIVGLVCDRRRKYPLTSLPATLVSLACVAVYAVQISRTTLVEPAVNILALLLAVRLVTEKNGRNYSQIFVLAIFTLAGSTLLSLSIGFFAYLILLVVLVTVGLVLLSFHAVDPDLVLNRPQVKKILGAALLLPAASLLLMLFFFAILPRTEHPLWNFLNPGPKRASGFSDQVRPGSFADIAATEGVAFRVGGESLDPEQLYWRTIVLNAIDGATWVREDPPPGETARVVGGRRVTLDFFCEPRQGRYLPTLDPPVQVTEAPTRDVGERVFTTQRHNERRQRYRVTAMVGGYLEQPGRIDRDFYLLPPVAVSERVAAVGRRVAAEGAAAEERIALLEAFFRDQRLSYATTDLPGPEDPVTAFLFEKKRGNCEFFASSFAQLLRLSGVPARLVGGYYGGAYNELGGYYLVGEETAHVWVEALLDDGRWRRVDPSRLAENAASAWLSARANPIGPARRLADAIDYFWTQAVITYDFSRQFELARAARDRLRGRAPTLPVKPLAGILTALILLGLAWRGWRGRGKSREERILQDYLRAARNRHGLAAIPENVGLRELAERLDDPRCRTFADIYGGALYRDRRLSAGELQRLREIVRELRKDGAAPPGG